MSTDSSQTKFSLATGWLLAYAITGLLVSVGIGYEAYKDFSVPLLITTIGFGVVGVLLLVRSHWSVPANLIFSLFLIALGVIIWYRVGRPSYLVAAVLCLVSTPIFREELTKQRAWLT